MGKAQLRRDAKEAQRDLKRERNEYIAQARALCRGLSRKHVVEILEGSLCIACYDSESTGVLQTALLENIKDRTMSLSTLQGLCDHLKERDA